MEEFWQRFDAFSTQLQNLAGAAWHNLVLYKQAESIGYLGIGLISLIIGLGLIVWIVRSLAPNWVKTPGEFTEVAPPRYDDKTRETHEYYMWKERRQAFQRDAGEPNVSPIILSIAAGFTAFILLAFVAGPNLLYIWNWIGAFVPEARLFHDVFEALKDAPKA